MKTFKILVAILILIVLGIASIFVFGSYSSGYRAGKIMKLSERGFIFKTHEGQLDIGGLERNEADGAATTIWSFSVKEEAVIEDINNAVDRGSNVKLHYREKYYKFFFYGDTKYFVYKVEEIKDKK